MNTQKKNRITVSAQITASKENVWEYWTTPQHIVNWNFASDEWYCPSAENDLKPSGKFSWRMEAKDGSMGFDYSGQYESIKTHEIIELTLDDGRKVTIEFSESDGKTEVIESFEPDENDPDLQRQGWQAILDNFKAYVEGK
jgi:uncharacterized protein YndB with AHSA1/START domain